MCTCSACFFAWSFLFPLGESRCDKNDKKLSCILQILCMDSELKTLQSRQKLTNSKASFQDFFPILHQNGYCPCLSGVELIFICIWGHSW